MFFSAKKMKSKKVVEKKIPRHQLENIKKIAVAVAKNPKAPEREIAKVAWVPKSTVHDNIGRVGHIKEDWLEELLSIDKQIMKSATKEINRRINDEEEAKQIKATELSTITQHSADRYMKFRGAATDEKWWLVDLSQLDGKALEERIKQLLNQ